MTVNFPTPAPRGWECPKCGAVWAPSMTLCTRCYQQAQTTSTNSGTVSEGFKALARERLRRREEEITRMTGGAS